MSRNQEPSSVTEFFAHAEAEDKVGETVIAMGDHFPVPNRTRGRIISLKSAGDPGQFLVVIQWDPMADVTRSVSKDEYLRYLIPVSNPIA